MIRVTTIAGVLLALAASLARAEDDRQRYEVHPSLRIVGIADDNVFLEDEDRDEAVGVWIQPGLEASYHTRTHELGVDLMADVRRTLGESSLDVELWRAKVFGEFGMAPGFTLRLSHTLAPQPIQLGLPENDTDNLAQTHRAEAELRYWRELPHARELEVGVRGTRFLGESFRADVLDSDGMLVVDDDFRPDFWEGAAYAEIQNPLGRLTSVYLRSQFRSRWFDDAPRSDHMDVSLLAGVRTRRFRNLEIEMAGGWGYLIYDEEGDRQRFLARSSIRHRLPRGWSWQLAAASRFSEDLTAEQFTETSVKLGVEKRFGERTAATLSLFAASFESENKDRDENLWAGGEIAVRRQLTRKMQARVRYRHWRNAGDYDFDDFYQNQIALELSYRY